MIATRFMMAIVILAMASPALCDTADITGVTFLGSSFDEVVERQSAGMESVFFGRSMLGNGLGNSIAIHPYVGFYGYEGILSGVGGSWHTTTLVPWDLGVGVGIIDLDFTSWTVAVSSGRQVWSNERATLALEGALGYQFIDEDPDRATAVIIDPPDPNGGYGPEVILDSFTFVHLMAHAVYTIDWWILRPVVDLGWVGTRYSLDGYEWEGGFPVTQGESRDDSDTSGKVTWGLGSALVIDRVILFGGVKVVGDAGLFQVNVGFEF